MFDFIANLFSSDSDKAEESMDRSLDTPHLDIYEQNENTRHFSKQLRLTKWLMKQHPLVVEQVMYDPITKDVRFHKDDDFDIINGKFFWRSPDEHRRPIEMDVSKVEPITI
jgi:hypothetical protein